MESGTKFWCLLEGTEPLSPRIISVACPPIWILSPSSRWWVWDAGWSSLARGLVWAPVLAAMALSRDWAGTSSCLGWAAGSPTSMRSALRGANFSADTQGSGMGPHCSITLLREVQFSKHLWVEEYQSTVTKNLLWLSTVLQVHRTHLFFLSDVYTEVRSQRHEQINAHLSFLQSETPT